ncbi:MAG TPA: PIN domain-containing protein [Rubrobacteraceae bacterium]|nr:PIN domain-containing protein [Rubrobacteraceae bacterium]
MLDTSVVVAFMNRRDDDHERVSAWMETTGEDLVTTPLVVAEIEHLVSCGGGSTAARAFYENLATGAYLVEWWSQAMFETVEAGRGHQPLGLADASLLALATRRLRRGASRRSTSATSAPPARSPGGRFHVAPRRCVTLARGDTRTRTLPVEPVV